MSDQIVSLGLVGWKIVNGHITFDLSEDEQPYIDVNKLCQQLSDDDSAVKKDDLIRIQKKTMAEGLTTYATTIFKRYKGEAKSQKRIDEIEKGVSALLKAASLSQSPFPYFQAGQLYEVLGRGYTGTAFSFYRYFLERCSEMNIQDADEAIELAKQKVQEMNPETRRS